MDVRRSVAMVWRSLRSMRTALVLLLLVGLASMAGALVPQRGVADPRRIARLVADHPVWARFLDRAGLFNVYGSWWFTFLYALLLVSLVACLIPRTRALVRNLRARPEPMRELDGLRHVARATVPGRPDQAIERARRVLRRRWFRVHGPPAAEGDPRSRVLAAEKGLAREAGSLVFHWAFLLILIGAVFGKGTGFTGFGVIVEGETWTEAHVAYDGQIQEGRFFGEAHTGIGVRVRDFTVRYREDTSPASFTTTADLLDPEGRPLDTVEISVNHPARVAGVKLYQFAFGWAPVVEVRAAGELVASGPIVFTQAPGRAGVDRRALPWRGVLELPTIRPQVGLVLRLWPDRRALVLSLRSGGEVRLPMLEADDPVLLVTAYRGDLDLTSPRPGSALPLEDLEEFATEGVGEGERVALPGSDIEISFPELREYTVLQVSRDRGVLLVLVAAILILVGLMPALYTSRRRVFVRAEADGTGTVLHVGGYALQRKDRFEEEFAGLVEELGAEAEEGSSVR
jgi:cytochrome c biogenesis protein